MVICLTAFSCGILIKQKNWWKHMKNAYISNKMICFVLLIYLHFIAVGWHVGCIRNKQIKNTARPFFLGFLQPIKHLSSMLSVMHTRIFLEEQKCATRETCEHTHPTKKIIIPIIWVPLLNSAEVPIIQKIKIRNRFLNGWQFHLYLICLNNETQNKFHEWCMSVV